MRDVEQSRGGAHGVVLGEVGGVADGHEPAAEVGERCAERGVAVVQRRGAGVGHEFSRRRSGRRRTTSENSPSVMGLRASLRHPSIETDAGGFHRRRIHVGTRDHFSERPDPRGTRDLRDWRGGLLLRCPTIDAVEALPRGSFGLSSVARPAYRRAAPRPPPTPRGQVVQWPGATESFMPARPAITGVSSFTVMA